MAMCPRHLAFSCPPCHPAQGDELLARLPSPSSYHPPPAALRLRPRLRLPPCHAMPCQVSGPFFQAPPGSRVALLVNNLGATPPLELLVVAAEAARYCRHGLGLAVARLLVGPYMTSLDMAGCSLTLLLLPPGAGAEAGGEGGPDPDLDPVPEPDLLGLLDSPASAAGWLGGMVAKVKPPRRPLWKCHVHVCLHVAFMFMGIWYVCACM